ncbi:MAG: MATE family efflux transporter [Petrimonas sp.]|uniref:Multidrug export protein MepA n=1 Tax=bioreactor metagenome TaxID=1076179 RepID=A0A644YPI0_9ZZZZ|nr:MATE family efflux transporter [Petrimonas sp.]BBD46877.1 MATE efflux family protein [Petrimonas sp. IBARAKI]MDD2910044.1 MATE family efflux transporter [Petrimonas sp.]MDD3541796.1 MATE family efflux transporter [Petrimonas sp.]MDD4014136.1 MATE family efflux transporter [Petrimonas sp.]
MRQSITDTELTLETKKISVLVWEYSIPAIIGTLVNSLYNIVDRIFIGQGVGAYAISGLAITFPVTILASSLGMLVGVGAASRISISLGERKKHTAEQILGNSLILILLFNAVIMTLFYVYLDPILLAFGATANTLPYAREYLQIVLIGNVFISLCYSFNNMMRASGYPKKAMITMLIGALLNIILDPVFIFVFDLGIAGVAWATVISMFVGMLFVMHHFIQDSSLIRLRKENIRLNKNIVLAIVSIGLSPFFMQVAASGVAVLLNTSLLKHGGDLAVGAYGILNSMLLIIIMTVVGLNQGTQPIIGYNYGAGNFLRVKDTFFYTVKVATIITSAGFIIGMFFPRQFASAFTGDQELLEIAENGIRLSLIAFPLVGFQVVAGNFFQSIGQAKKAIIQSLSRQIIFLVPGLLIFPALLGLNGVWIAMPVSDFLASLLSLYLLVGQIRIIRNMQENQPLYR